MKILVFLLVFLSCLYTAFPQNKSVDSLLQKIAVEKDENKKVDLIVSIWDTPASFDPYPLIQTGQVLLRQAAEDDDLIKEASAYCFLGTGYRISGNPIRALQVQQKGLLLAEKANNYSILAMVKNQMGHTYRDRDDWENAFKIYSLAMVDAGKGQNEVIKIWPQMNLGVCYLNLNKLDSALKYLQRAYESSLVINQVDLPYILWNLGSVHSKMGHAPLAVSYFHMAIELAEKPKRLRQLSLAYTGLAEHFLQMKEQDSCMHYLKKVLNDIQHTPFFFMSVKPARMLADLYEESNCDSTLKYAKIYKIAGDSVFSNKINQQIQLMTFDEQLRQQELAAENIKTEEQRRQNIQFALIALGIIVFIVLFLLFSHSIVANQQLISFFGVLGLLIVFEFINLLIHPWLASYTHESPVFMLLALVIIASLLIPLHHRLEKWIKEKMTEKNKEIRLAAAKKTIEQLEEKRKNQ